MKTLILDQPGHFRLADTAAPSQPDPGEALVRVRRVGICGTDLHAFQGNQPFFSYPRILGHELGVEIVALGADNPNPHIQVGDICAVEPYLNCGQCSACCRGKTNCCRSLKVLGVHTDGGMREWITVPVHKLHKAPSASLDHLAMVEMLCIGAHAVRRGQPLAGENVLVIGAGPIGLSVIQFAQLTGANVILLEMNEKRAEFAQEFLGVPHWISPKQEVVPALQNLLGGDLPTMIFDATGNVKSMHNALTYMEQGSKLVFVGIVQADITFSDPEFQRREMTLMSSRNAMPEDFAHVISSIEAGKVNLNPWITHRADPEQLVNDFASWLKPETGVVKAMLEFD